jgi:hypothetical protein
MREHLIGRRKFGMGALAVIALGGCAPEEAPLSAVAATPRALRDADIAARLTGHWIVVIDDTPRTRQLEILAVEAEGDGRFRATARYGYTGERLQDVTLRGRDEGGAVAFDFVTPNKNAVAATLGNDGRFIGRIDYPTGASAGTARHLAIRESAAEQLLADKYVVVRETKFTLIYVGADNCGPCAAWERDVGPGTRSAFVAGPLGRSVAFREVHARTYMNTAEPSRWPEDLLWLVKATNVASGTPRYIVMVDRKIVLNSQGRFSTRVEPLLRELVARRASA